MLAQRADEVPQEASNSFGGLALKSKYASISTLNETAVKRWRRLGSRR